MTNSEGRITALLRTQPPDEPHYVALGPDLFRRTGAGGGVHGRTRSAMRLGVALTTVLAVVLAVPLLIRQAAPGIVAPGPDDVWSYKGGPGRTGEMPGPAPEEPLVAMWTVRYGRAVNSAPVVVEGRLVFVASTRRVVALDPADGTERWASADASYVGSPATDGRLVFAVGIDGSLSGVAVATGQTAWHRESAILANSSPLVLDGWVFAAGEDGIIYAFDAATGVERWRLATDAPLDRSIAASGDDIVFGAGGTLYAKDARSGASRWSFPTTASGFSTPSVRDNVVYGNAGLTLYAVDAATGTELWQRRTPDGLGFRSPSVDQDRVYIGTVNHVYALSRADGSVLWTAQVDTITAAAIAVVDDTLILFGDDTAYGLDATSGAERWTFDVGGDVESGTTVVDGRFFAMTDFGDAIAVGTSPDSVPAPPSSP